MFPTGGWHDYAKNVDVPFLWAQESDEHQVLQGHIPPWLGMDRLWATTAKTERKVLRCRSRRRSAWQRKRTADTPGIGTQSNGQTARRGSACRTRSCPAPSATPPRRRGRRCWRRRASPTTGGASAATRTTRTSAGATSAGATASGPGSGDEQTSTERASAVVGVPAFAGERHHDGEVQCRHLRPTSRSSLGG